MTAHVNSRPRKFQFGLRSVLVLMFVCAVGLSCLRVAFRKSLEQRAAVAAIRELGGSVYYAQPPSGARPPAWLQSLLSDDCFATPFSVDLANTQFTSAALVHLKQLPELGTLDLENTSVTDDDLKHLAGLKKLGFLILDNTNISGTGLADLGGLTKLDCLSLSHTKITDVALEHLKQFSSLRRLRLGGTTVSDAGLENLGRLSQLEHVELFDTRVTVVGVEKLKQLLPKCDVERWPLPMLIPTQSGHFLTLPGPWEPVEVIHITALPSRGQLHLRGAPIAVGDSLQWDDLRALKYTPNVSDANSDSFQCTASVGACVARMVKVTIKISL